ncbi:hypothetical protein BC835DRAFT_293454 [Cytidiella melzeri]|nr:hypothetical protein BC835DRAFT_293454 [Cytidiella melzeri]
MLAFLDDLLDHKQKIREICDIQTDIVRAMVPACATEIFEKRSRGIVEKRRREVVLEGLYCTSCLAELEERRGLCLGSTVSSLSASGGREYPRMLREVLPSTPLSETATIVMPAYITCIRVKFDYIWALASHERRNSILGWQTRVNDNMFDRTYFASVALWNILLVFEGRFHAVCSSKRSTGNIFGTKARKERSQRSFREECRRGYVSWHASRSS